MTEIEQRMMRPVGKLVHYRYPAGEGDRRGILKRRKIVQAGPGRAGVQYWDVVDVIKFDNESEPWVRVGYYRQRPDGTLGWAGQTTITEPLSVWRGRLLPAIQHVVTTADAPPPRPRGA